MLLWFISDFHRLHPLDFAFDAALSSAHERERERERESKNLLCTFFAKSQKLHSEDTPQIQRSLDLSTQTCIQCHHIIESIPKIFRHIIIYIPRVSEEELAMWGLKLGCVQLQIHSRHRQ
jgi:hypothetical protein